jgi:ATP-binding cassette, subfamily B, multidrug efflux pump|tara:strand:- start:1268 stop:3028 length:1761 start_codon:yes stop_codon:yes gene_type:complete
MSETVTGKAFDLSLLKRVMVYSYPYKKTFAFTSLLTLLLALLAPARPLIIQYMLDNTILVPNKALLINLTILMVGLLILETIVQFYQTYLANWLGQIVIKDMRMGVYKKISSFKLKYFDNNAIGTLVTRTISDIETIADVFSNGILIIGGDLLKLVVVVIVMFYTNWKLSILSLASIPVLLIATNMFKNYIKIAFQDVRTQVSRLNAFVQEHITGMNIVQVFNREEQEFEKFKTINELHKKAHVKTVWANSVFFPVVEVLSAFSLAFVVWWGAGSIVEDSITFGELFAFILYIYMLFRPIRQLADRFNVLQMGMVASERVFKVLDTNSVIEDSGSKDASGIVGDIKFENVWFAYNEPEFVLKELNFEVEEGKTLAFVGATGAGKTSIINLLSRFYEYQKGDIFIDKVNLKDFELQSLRRNIGVVLQDVFLFSDTIYNNITLNNDSLSLDKVIEAAKVVGAHDFIMKLPNNYNYHVGERGAVLSVGQRQLVAFIRAYVYNPKILVLDEATSSIDTESEELIQRAIEKLTEGRTSVIIAHRLATIQKADKIIVLEKGRIIEQGNHQELLKQDGHYKNLYEIQFKSELS